MPGKRKYYAIHGSAHQGVYETWNECKQYCIGKKGVKFKGFKSKDIAEYFAKHGAMPEVEHEEGVLKIYTDGACNDKGMAGIGAYFPAHPEWNISEPFTIGERTNQRAEIWAIVQAMMKVEEEGVPVDQEIQVYTDSKYCFRAYWHWIKNWKKNGWKTTQGTDVKNREMFEMMYDLCMARDVKIVHVNSHCGNKGNEEADKLAVKGCFLK